MSQPLTILGGITAEQFLNEYWQKKPLLVRGALPEIANILEPNDVMELALEDNVSARLIKQKDRDPNQWSVKSSPLTKSDFQKMPKLWTLLVQAVDHYSMDLAELWQRFSFIPQWRRDDIMVSYAQKAVQSANTLTFMMCSWFKAMVIAVGSLGKCVMQTPHLYPINP